MDPGNIMHPKRIAITTPFSKFIDFGRRGTTVERFEVYHEPRFMRSHFGSSPRAQHKTDESHSRQIMMIFFFFVVLRRV